MSMLLRIQNNSQLRFSYSTGFRSPQAFDADLHISFWVVVFQELKL